MIKKNDISTWMKTSDLLYSTEEFETVLKVLELERKHFKRPYNIMRIRGRLKRVYRKALATNPSLLDGVRPSQLASISVILEDVATIRTYLKLSNLSLNQLYSFLKYEVTHRNRLEIKYTIINYIIQEPNCGIRKGY